jgi:ABC-type multidrug transport system fused ATPase/permease subunit
VKAVVTQASAQHLIADVFRLWAHLSPKRRWQLGGLLLLTLLGALAEVASLGAVLPFLALLADPSLVDRYPVVRGLLDGAGVAPGHRVFAAAAAFGLITVCSAAIRVVNLRVSGRFVFALGADLGNEVYQRSIHQPYAVHVARNSSEVIAGINRVIKVVTGVIFPIVQASVALITSLAILLVLLRIDWVATSVATCSFLVLYTLAGRLTRPRLRANSAIITRNDAQRIQTVQEALGGIRDLIIDNTHAVYTERFNHINRETRRAEALNHFLGGAPRYLIEAVGMVLIVGLACWLSLRPAGLAGALPVLGALALGAQRLMPQLQQVFNAWSSINASRAQLQNTLLLLAQPMPPQSTPLPPAEPASAWAAAPGTPVVSLQGVGFRYVERGSAVIEQLDLDIAPGARVGFVGTTGSGKSTLIDLILGLLVPQQGQIVVNGQPLTDLNRRAWQDCLAHVPQSIFLSDASLASNIALGVPPAQIDPGRLREAARRAQIHDFIQTLPRQYDTPVGERGVRLSGGQRQRIGLARAFYKQATVLVLDEATSALDDQTEAEVMKTIDELGPDVTVLMIAHRLSTLRACDLIVELQGGRIARVGNYTTIIGGREATLAAPAPSV